MTTVGRRKGVRRYGTAHGLRMSETMESVVRGYAKRAGVTVTDGLRLLLEQAIGLRVNAVEEQAERLARIEGIVGEIRDMVWEARLPGEEGVREITIAARHGKTNAVAMQALDWAMHHGSEEPREEDGDTLADLMREYYEGSGWE